MTIQSLAEYLHQVEGYTYRASFKEAGRRLANVVLKSRWGGGFIE